MYCNTSLKIYQVRLTWPLHVAGDARSVEVLAESADLARRLAETEAALAGLIEPKAYAVLECFS